MEESDDSQNLDGKFPSGGRLLLFSSSIFLCLCAVCGPLRQTTAKSRGKKVAKKYRDQILLCSLKYKHVQTVFIVYFCVLIIDMYKPANNDRISRHNILIVNWLLLKRRQIGHKKAGGKERQKNFSKEINKFSSWELGTWEIFYKKRVVVLRLRKRNHPIFKAFLKVTCARSRSLERSTAPLAPKQDIQASVK